MKRAQRHQQFRTYLQGVTARIERGTYWRELSPEFDAVLEESGFRNKGESNFLPGIVGRDEAITHPTFHKAGQAYTQAMQVLKGPGHPPETASQTISINGKEYFIGGPRSGLFFGNMYAFERLAHAGITSARYLEIGGGSGFLAALMHNRYNCQVFIVDLPEMLSVSSAFLLHTFPDKTFLLADEFDESCDLLQYDFILLTPDLISSLPQNHFDLVINKASFMEMDQPEVNRYFRIIDGALAENGIFYCSNRPVKKTVMFDYPWESQVHYEDLFYEINQFKARFPNEFIDRCRRKTRHGQYVERVKRNPPHLASKWYRSVRDAVWNRKIQKKYPFLAKCRNGLFNLLVRIPLVSKAKQ